MKVITHINKSIIKQRAEKALKDSNFDDELIRRLKYEKLIYEIKLLNVEIELFENEYNKLFNEFLDSEEKFYEFYNLSPVGFLTVNNEGIVKEVNIALLSILNVEKKDIILKNFSDFIKADDNEKFIDCINGIVDDYCQKQCEIELIKNDGDTLICNIKGKRSKKEDYIRLVVDDISEHVNNEKRLTQLLKQLSVANETINSQNFDLRELNTKLELSRTKLNQTIKHKDEFLNFIYKDLTQVFTRFLILSECISEDPSCRRNPDILVHSQDLYSSVKETIKLIDKYFLI